MLLLTSTSDIVRVITGAAADIEVHSSYVDNNSGVITPGRANTPSITTATTTTIVGAPGSGVQRNVKHLNITNNHSTISCQVTVEHTDGTSPVELVSVTLLPGECLIFTAVGQWVHQDQNGATYPPVGLGAYTGYPVGFMKSSTGSDAAGYWYCTSKDSGFPGAWSPGTPGLNGRNTDGTNSADFGCIPIKNPAVGANYLTEIQIASSVAHLNMFFDILWVNTGLVVTTTTAQAISMGALPPRDINGSTDGVGCMIGLLCTAASGLAAVASNATVSYTNSENIAGRTATLSAIVGSQAPATPVIGTVIWFSLQAGDRGVRSIQSITLNTSWVSGTISLFIAREIATIGTVLANIGVARIIAAPGIRLYNGTCMLHCVLSSAATATFFAGELVIQEK